MKALSVPGRLVAGGDWTVLARAAWLCVTLLIGVLFAAGTPVTYDHLHAACSVSPCLNWQLPPSGIHHLHSQGLSLDFYAGYIVAVELATAVVWLVISTVLIWSAPMDRVAVLAAVLLILFRGATFGGIVSTLGTEPDWQWPVRITEIIGQSGLIPFFYVFPDGRFVPARARWLALLGVLIFLPNLLIFTGIWSRTAWWAPGVLTVSFAGGLAGPLVAQIYRYRRISGTSERQQTKWVVFGLGILIIGTITLTLLTVALSLTTQAPVGNMVGEAAWNALALLIPITIGISVLRYRLWDVDLVINRTLVYGTLTGSIVGVYVLVVAGLGRVFQAQGNLLLSLLGAGFVVMLFQPLRERLQRAVNHVMYGERDDPYAVVSRLGQRLEGSLSPEEVLPTVVETVTQALKLPYVAIALRAEGGFSVVASRGAAPSAPRILPLVYRGETVGQLLLAPRSGESGFSAADTRLLADLARQAGIAGHAVLLTADLQRSRERLVTAREEERRRLRRDLHDGLGPALASLTLKLDAARNLLRRDPDSTDTLLLELKGQVQGAITDIRRVVYALRPPTLDELGLISAIREQAKQYQSNGLAIIVEAPEGSPTLPAAVEVAVYRIVQEALTNVVRHAQARTCHVCLSLNGDLSLEITDDGRGLSGTRPGVGLSSMRERAEELGGTCKVESGGHGTRLLVRFPLHTSSTDTGEIDSPGTAANTEGQE